MHKCTPILGLLLVFLTGCPDTPGEIKTKDTLSVVSEGVIFENMPVGSFTKAKLNDLVSQFGKQYRQERNKKVYHPVTWEITDKETEVFEVDEKNTVQMILDAKAGRRINARLTSLPWEKVKSEVESLIQTKGEYITILQDGDVDRTNNILLACKKINNYKIKPSQEFSFNGTVGARTKEKGYRSAPIIVMTEDGAEKEEGIGGGICQLSSTLYNAVRLADLTVLERHSHSKPVAYVPKGRDAAVSYKGFDFRFLNSGSHPVKIRAFVKSGKLNVRIDENLNES